MVVYGQNVESWCCKQVWQKDNELIPRHVEFQVSNQLALGESKPTKSEVTARDEYL